MLKKFLLSLPDVLLVCIVIYITYTTTLSFVQMLVISIAIGIVGGFVIRICKDVFTYIRWTIKQRKFWIRCIAIRGEEMTKKKSRVKNEIALWTLTAVVLIIVWYFFKDKNASYLKGTMHFVFLPIFFYKVFTARFFLLGSIFLWILL